MNQMWSPCLLFQSHHCLLELMGVDFWPIPSTYTFVVRAKLNSLLFTYCFSVFNKFMVIIWTMHWNFQQVFDCISSAQQNQSLLFGWQCVSLSFSWWVFSKLIILFMMNLFLSLISGWLVLAIEIFLRKRFYIVHNPSCIFEKHYSSLISLLGKHF